MRPGRVGLDYARGIGGIGRKAPDYGFSAHHVFAPSKQKMNARLPYCRTEKLNCLSLRQDDMKCR
jgi:hypothetical protein